MTTTTCAGCGRTNVEIASRYLCKRCYMRAWRMGTLARYPDMRRGRPPKTEGEGPRRPVDWKARAERAEQITAAALSVIECASHIISDARDKFTFSEHFTLLFMQELSGYDIAMTRLQQCLEETQAKHSSTVSLQEADDATNV